MLDDRNIFSIDTIDFLKLLELLVTDEKVRSYGYLIETGHGKSYKAHYSKWDEHKNITSKDIYFEILKIKNENNEFYITELDFYLDESLALSVSNDEVSVVTFKAHLNQKDEFLLIYTLLRKASHFSDESIEILLESVSKNQDKLFVLNTIGKVKGIYTNLQDYKNSL